MSLEQKKQMLLEILRSLFGIFDLAEAMHAYIENEDLDENTISGLIDLFINEINNASDESKNTLMLQTLDRLKEMKKIEETEKDAERKEALDLLTF